MSLGIFVLRVIGGTTLVIKFSGMTREEFYNTVILYSMITVPYLIIQHVRRNLFKSWVFTDNTLFQASAEHDSIITIICFLIGSIFVTISILLRYGSYLVYFKSDKDKINRN